MELFVIGYIVGAVITMIIFRFFLVGTLVVDNSDPFDGPFLFLELTKKVKSVANKKYVILKVNLKNSLSHK